MGLIPTFIGALIFTIVEALTFFFVVVATPTSQFDTIGKGCYTLWGYKPDCQKTNYWAHNRNYGCARVKNNMNGGAAFAIISIAATLVTLILGVLMLARVAFPVLVTIVFSALCVVTILISWACVADVHNAQFCGVNMGSYGAGFALMVTAWVLQVLNLVLIFVIVFA